jgi:hypothetical protein
LPWGQGNPSFTLWRKGEGLRLRIHLGLAAIFRITPALWPLLMAKHTHDLCHPPLPIYNYPLFPKTLLFSPCTSHLTPACSLTAQSIAHFTVKVLNSGV